MTDSSNKRLALVSGAGSGLGREFCVLLGKSGWYVIATDIDLSTAHETLQQVENEGGSGEAYQLDVTQLASWQELLASLRSSNPRLDLLINNAGISAAGLIGDGTLEDFQKVLGVNLMGVVHGCHTCVPWFKETAPGGAIVNVASIAAVLNAPAMAAYSTAKAGVVSLSETLHCELSPWGIGVTVVLPGFFATELLARGSFPDERYRQIAQAYVSSASFNARDVAEQTLRAVERKKLYVVLGRRARLAWRLRRLAPITFQKLVAWKFARDSRRVNPAD